jgi:hypothetical protein
LRNQERNGGGIGNSREFRQLKNWLPTWLATRFHLLSP